MKKKFIKGFLSIYSIICIIVLLMVLFNKDFSFLGLVQYLEGSSLFTILNSVRSYWGSLNYYISNFSTWSDLFNIIGNGFMAIISALFLPIQFIVSVLSYILG